MPKHDLWARSTPVLDPANLRAKFAQTNLSVSRGELVAQLQALRQDQCAQIETHLSDHPHQAEPVISAYARLADALVQTAYQAACQKVLNQGQTDSLCIMGVGGYGRAQMAPFSDIDLLFLIPKKPDQATHNIIEEMLYILWDLNLKVGHATRNIKECLSLAQEDQTIMTSLLELRHIVGASSLSDHLQDALERSIKKSNPAPFIDLKLQERAARHAQQGGQRYMLEPNVKEGKGGLRDLQSMFWIMRYISGANTHDEMIQQRYFTADEYALFQTAHTFLWAVRCHLHLAAGRACEQLTFDLQIELAHRMGYTDAAGRRGVEIFMQDYFRHATFVGELTRVFVTALEEQHVKASPSFADRIKNMIWQRSTESPKLNALFVLDNARINLHDNETFLSDPVNILRLFREGLRTGHMIHQNAMRVVVANLHLFTDKLRQDPKAQQIFLSLLLDYGDPTRALRRMNELGVLGAFIPEFKRIIAMMQFNVYHHYTVDEHTIQTISVLSKLERGDLDQQLPIVAQIVKGGINRRVLYVALLLHDIGKGLPEDHSIAGARLAAQIAPALGLDTAETDLVVWLVRHHLSLSDFAQKRDLSDPRTVANFTTIVQTMNRLNLLTVLTACDIMGVGPGTLNNWRAQLIRELYFATRAQLISGVDKSGRYLPQDDAKAELSQNLTDWPDTVLQQELNRHYAPYWRGLDLQAHIVFAKMLRDLGDKTLDSHIEIDPERDATRVHFVMQDHPGIFSRMAGALAVVGANVVDARTYTSSDGYATSLFWVQNKHERPFTAQYHDRLRQTVLKTMAGEVIPRARLGDKNKLKKREREFEFPTEIIFDNDGSDIYTIIEVETRDRPSLLYDLTRVFHHNNIQIANAVIATYGAQAVDVFYVKDMVGLKIHNQNKQDKLAQKLRDAIEHGAKAARA